MRAPEQCCINGTVFGKVCAMQNGIYAFGIRRYLYTSMTTPTPISRLYDRALLKLPGMCPPGACHTVGGGDDAIEGKQLYGVCLLRACK